jgi:hypothetical protein
MFERMSFLKARSLSLVPSAALPATEIETHKKSTGNITKSRAVSYPKTTSGFTSPLIASLKLRNSFKSYLRTLMNSSKADCSFMCFENLGGIYRRVIGMPFFGTTSFIRRSIEIC